MLYCTASWLHKNSAAQAELIGSLLPSDNAAPPTGVTAGQLLCGALFSTDATTSWLASCVFSHAILNQCTGLGSFVLKIIYIYNCFKKIALVNQLGHVNKS